MTDLYIDHFDNFESISEFKYCVEVGTELGFIFDSKEYFICYSKTKLCIYEKWKEDTEVYFDTFNDLLEYRMGNTRLGDVVKEIEITERFL